MTGRPHPSPTSTVAVVPNRTTAVGLAVARRLEREGWDTIDQVGLGIDLCDRDAVRRVFAEHRPAAVILAPLSSTAVDDADRSAVLSDCLRRQANVFDAAVEHGVRRLVYLGSSASYPRYVAQPAKESDLLCGPPAIGDEVPAVCSAAGLTAVQAVREQHGLDWTAAVPSEVYGSTDDGVWADDLVFTLTRRYLEAARDGLDRVVNPGAGTLAHDLLHVDDLADALVFLLFHYDGGQPVNIGSGRSYTTAEIATMVSMGVEFAGRTAWDPSRADESCHVRLDASRLASLGWTVARELREGIGGALTRVRSVESGLSFSPIAATGMRGADDRG
ncbi:GDP-L-fucose synthase [Gordonia spumicola]|uniref:GDP-L-fucose synthase n=1 Tax=Gordonia spumicola TaxID=589161 RepID=A0A7I9V4K7_9ACTN|nr:NAD-dependent epimerase/dehydratase family protein [Gordonia spumicola]GEE00365.1 GDP-L-fucose synthase [Gordonia spumicola]